MPVMTTEFNQHPDIRMSLTFNRPLRAYPTKVRGNIQRAVIGTIEDLAPELGIPSITFESADLGAKGVAARMEETPKGKERYMLFDTEYLRIIALAQRFPIIGSLAQWQLKWLTAHEMHHLRDVSEEQRSRFLIITSEELSQNFNSCADQWIANEEEYDASVFATRYIDSLRSQTLQDALAKRLAVLGANIILSLWRQAK